MKSIIAISLFLTTSFSAWGSHFQRCDIEVKITKVKKLARLDGNATFTRRTREDNEQVVVVDVTKVVSKQQAHECLAVGVKDLELYVKHSQRGDYKVGQTLKVSYRNVGDSLGSSISWDLN